MSTKVLILATETNVRLVSLNVPQCSVQQVSSPGARLDSSVLCTGVLSPAPNWSLSSHPGIMVTNLGIRFPMQWRWNICWFFGSVRSLRSHKVRPLVRPSSPNLSISLNLQIRSLWGSLLCLRSLLAYFAGKTKPKILRPVCEISTIENNNNNNIFIWNLNQDII